MLYLCRNGKLIREGGAEVLEDFESRIKRWNNEHSGWDEHGIFWSLREETVVDKRVIASERCLDGECAVCGRRHIHRDDCATLARREKVQPS